jgi:hypothetical protein
MNEEKPPILKTWNNVYSLLIGVLVAVIIGMYFFTQYFK